MRAHGDPFEVGVKAPKRRKPEDELNDHLLASMNGMDPVRIENSIGTGQPDINFTQGWIESKRVPKWPARADTLLRVDHYTSDQRGWHSKRRRAGGLVLVVIQVADDYLVLDALDAAPMLGFSTKAELFNVALLSMEGSWDGALFRKWLTEYTERFLTSRGFSTTISKRWRGQS